MAQAKTVTISTLEVNEALRQSELILLQDYSGLNAKDLKLTFDAHGVPYWRVSSIVDRCVKSHSFRGWDAKHEATAEYAAIAL